MASERWLRKADSTGNLELSFLAYAFGSNALWWPLSCPVRVLLPLADFHKRFQNRSSDHWPKLHHPNSAFGQMSPNESFSYSLLCDLACERKHTVTGEGQSHWQVWWKTLLSYIQCFSTSEFAKTSLSRLRRSYLLFWLSRVCSFSLSAVLRMSIKGGDPGYASPC